MASLQVTVRSDVTMQLIKNGSILSRCWVCYTVNTFVKLWFADIIVLNRCILLNKQHHLLSFLLKLQRRQHSHCWNVFAREAIGCVRNKHACFADCAITDNNTFDWSTRLSHDEPNTTTHNMHYVIIKQHPHLGFYSPKLDTALDVLLIQLVTATRLAMVVLPSE